MSQERKNTENRTGAHLASILAISLIFPERSRVHLGQKKNLDEKEQNFNVLGGFQDQFQPSEVHFLDFPLISLISL